MWWCSVEMLVIVLLLFLSQLQNWTSFLRSFQIRSQNPPHHWVGPIQICFLNKYCELESFDMNGGSDIIPVRTRWLVLSYTISGEDVRSEIKSARAKIFSYMLSRR